MSRSSWLVLAASLALVGCDSANKEAAQYDDSRNPYYKQAQQDLDNNNPTAAIDDYNAALAANPKLAGAHYELGIIYGDKLGYPIGSIFHFQEFLRLAPTSDKADQVKALVEKQSQAFAASLPNSPTQSADDYAKLQADNTSLKTSLDAANQKIAAMQAQLAKHHPGAAPTQTAAAPAPAPAPATETPPAPAPATPPVAADAGGTAPAPAPASTNTTPSVPLRALPLDATNAAPMAADTGTNAAADAGPSRTYKVVSGDSYWKIAKKMYPGDTKNGVEKIQDANKETVGKPLKIGQVLIIPQ